MKVTFISNFLNHHQTPFCNEMYKLFGDNFKFISIMPTPLEFINGGYEDCSNYVYNIRSYLNENSYKESLELSYQSDVVILGDAPYAFIKNRLKDNKLTFRFAERIFRDNLFHIHNLRYIYHILNRHTRYRYKNFYLLAAGAYAPKDYGFFFAYPQKKFKWGYFTSVDTFNIADIIDKKKRDILEIIWVARFIKLKHPEMVIKLAKVLKKEGKKFHITMIGTGNLWENIKNKAVLEGLENEISLIGNISNKLVREKMLKSNIFLFTSNKKEGWGAVLNEAMSSGCAVVVSKDIGAAPYLIKDGENGLLFKTNNIKDLSSKVIDLIDNNDFRKKIAEQAYFTISELWNPINAAKQFKYLSENILSGKEIIPIEGPCSIA